MKKDFKGGFTPVTNQITKSAPSTAVKPNCDSPYARAKHDQGAGRIDEHKELLQHKQQLGDDGANQCVSELGDGNINAKDEVEYCNIDSPHESCNIDCGEVQHDYDKLLPSVAKDESLFMASKEKDRVENELSVQECNIINSSRESCDIDGTVSQRQSNERAWLIDEHIQFLEHKLQLGDDGEKGTVTARCLDNSHPRVSPASGKDQNHGSDDICTEEDLHSRVNEVLRRHGFGEKWREDMNKEEQSDDHVYFPYDVERFGEFLVPGDGFLVGDNLSSRHLLSSSVRLLFAGRKMGTVIIVYLFNNRLYVASDSRLTTEDPYEDDEDLKYKICYEDSYKDLRLRIEEVGEKIISCENFQIAFAGNYTESHPMCTKLKKDWGKDETVSHCFLHEKIQDHFETDKLTDFLLVTPSTEPGRQFDISFVTADRTDMMDYDKPLWFGSGGDFAKDFIQKYIQKGEPKSHREVVEMLKEGVYHASRKEKATVGGMAVVSMTEVEDCGTSKKLVTKYLRFPSLKTIWPLSITPNRIRLPRASLMEIAERVWDLVIVNKVLSGEELDSSSIGQDLVRVRIYPGAVGPTFYQTSDLMKRTDFKDHSFTLGYNADLQEFTIGPIPEDNSSMAEFKLVYKLIAHKKNLFWDNESAVFVPC